MLTNERQEIRLSYRWLGSTPSCVSAVCHYPSFAMP